MWQFLQWNVKILLIIIPPKLIYPSKASTITILSLGVSRIAEGVISSGVALASDHYGTQTEPANSIRAGPTRPLLQDLAWANDLHGSLSKQVRSMGATPTNLLEWSLGAWPQGAPNNLKECQVISCLTGTMSLTPHWTS